MARVNISAMHEALVQLVHAGVLRTFDRRPFGMYTLELANGEILRPDTKETAMWVQGAMAGVGSLASRWQEAEAGRNTIAKYTSAEVEDALSNSKSVRSWKKIGADFDVVVEPLSLRRRQVIDALRAFDHYTPGVP